VVASNAQNTKNTWGNLENATAAPSVEAPSERGDDRGLCGGRAIFITPVLSRTLPSGQGNPRNVGCWEWSASMHAERALASALAWRRRTRSREG